jgi:GrpB-like predicted nucleotidyltransferase (UPF0157 family)
VTDPRATVVPYDPAWPDVFAALCARIAPALEGLDARIEHVGSTAVPGLAAKPIIDLDIVVPGPELVPVVVDRLAGLGYEHQGDLGIAGREAFQQPAGLPDHHLYVVVDGSVPYLDHVDLRDHLCANPADAERYARLKQAVAHLLSVDRDAYVNAKADLVRELLAKARGQG